MTITPGSSPLNPNPSLIQPVLSDSKEHIQEALAVIKVMTEHPEDSLSSLLKRVSPLQGIDLDSPIAKLTQILLIELRDRKSPTSALQNNRVLV